ncbi:citrate lyase acyl carrier protein [Sporomusa acidovorans]|nr:citrate lyase acyl carrier protein [Sporomusa acidovorans]
MTQLTQAQAGTLESNDIMITVVPNQAEKEVTIELQSLVLAQYGKQIRKVIADTVREQGVTALAVKAIDRGALDCTIRARTLTALSRAGVTLKEVHHGTEKDLTVYTGQ